MNITYEMVSAALRTAYDLRLIQSVNEFRERDFMKLILQSALSAQPIVAVDICHCGTEKYHYEHEQDPYCSKCGGKCR